MNANKLILNIEKTNYILFGTQTKIDNDLTLYYRDKEINRVYNTKFLGVYIDENSLGTSMLIIYVKLFLKISVFLYNLQFIHNIYYKFRPLYHSLVLSHLNYCSIVWMFGDLLHIRSCVIWWDPQIPGGVTFFPPLLDSTCCLRAIPYPIIMNLGSFYSKITLLFKYDSQLCITLWLISEKCRNVNEGKPGG